MDTVSTNLLSHGLILPARLLFTFSPAASAARGATFSQVSLRRTANTDCSSDVSKNHRGNDSDSAILYTLYECRHVVSNEIKTWAVSQINRSIMQTLNYAPSRVSSIKLHTPRIETIKISIDSDKISIGLTPGYSLWNS